MAAANHQDFGGRLMLRMTVDLRVQSAAMGVGRAGGTFRFLGSAKGNANVFGLQRTLGTVRCSGMAIQSDELSEQHLQAVVARMRRATTAAGEVGVQAGPTTLPISDEARKVLAALRQSDAYRQAVHDVADADSDLANC